MGLRSSPPKFGSNFLTGCKMGSVIIIRNRLNGSSPLGKIQDNITLPNMAIDNKVKIRSRAGFNAEIIYSALPLTSDICYKQL